MTRGQTKVAAAQKRPNGKDVETPQFFKAKVGDSLMGAVIGTEHLVYKKTGKEEDRYLLETVEGKLRILPADADLNTKVKRFVAKHGFGTRTLYLELTSETLDVGRPSAMKVWLVRDVTDAGVAKLPDVAHVASTPNGTAPKAKEEQVTLLGEEEPTPEDTKVPF